MRVSVYAQVTLKDKPKDYLGVSGESVSIGKDQFIGLADMMAYLLQTVGSYYGIFQTEDELNEQLDKLAVHCQRLRFRSEEEGEDGTVPSD